MDEKSVGEGLAFWTNICSIIGRDRAGRRSRRVAKQTGGVAAFEGTFGFPAPDAREREALALIRIYLRRVERALGRRALGTPFDGRDRRPTVGGEGAMATEAALLLTMRESVLG